VALWFLIVLLLWGLVVGALARLALPGPDPIGIPATIALGLAGSFLGGVVARLFLGFAGGLVFAVLGATAILYVYRRVVQKRGITGPDARSLPPR
jgi:uncharacterized membrane protein YeaQ/YmgE (transglycosylase-associated protein family)